MDFTFSAEQELLRDGLSKFLAGRYDLETSRAAAKSGPGWQPDIWQSFAEELGILGAAMAWAVSIVVDNVLAVLQVHRGLRVSSRGPGMVHAMVLSAAVFGGVGVLVRILLGPTLLGLVVAVVVAGALYLPLVRRSRKALELSVLGDALRSRGASGSG